MSEFDAEELHTVRAGFLGQPDLSRPECRNLDQTIKRLQLERKKWVDRYQAATSQEAKQEAAHNIEKIDDHISYWRDEMHFQGCFTLPTTVPRLLDLQRPELTQAIQYYSVAGSGAGADNSVFLVEGKALLVRVYMTSLLTEASFVNGYCDVMGYNSTTLKYDTLRRRITAAATPRMDPSASSQRNDIWTTLNFFVPPDLCWGQARFDVHAWFVGHESEPADTSAYHSSYSLSSSFQERRVPIIHCFRIALSQTVPGSPNPLQFAAPSFANCQTTMATAERLWPVSRLDIRDRGTRSFSGQLQTFNDYAAVRADIQTVYDGTTPTPEVNELFVAMMPTHQAPTGGPFGQQINQSLTSTVNLGSLFAHELGHWLLPGDDHVAGCVNPNLTLVQIDSNYPDYTNAVSRAGIGEWGVNLTGAFPWTLFGSEAGDIMSYCPLPLWISPYNYLRAFNGRILGWARDAAESSTLSDAQKLLIAFRLHRDQSVDLDWALHLPGEARAPSGKGRSDLFLELQDRNGVVLASLNCSRPADRAHTAPYEDFQEVLPWYDSASDVVVVCDQVELARWKVEDPVEQPLVGKPKVTETRQDDGTTAVKISWKAQAGAQTKPHLMLRYTPDDGRTWIPLANGINGSEVDVPQELLDGVESVRFQLAVSAGIRTTLVDVPDAVVGRKLVRHVAITLPEAGASILQGSQVVLAGVVNTRLDGAPDTTYAYWTSHRDGFLADGLRATVSGLSVGRHMLRLAVVDPDGAEVSQTLTVTVIPDTERVATTPY
jgi:hypothetical protein